MTPTNLTIETSGLGKVISKIATITTELPYGGLEDKLVNCEAQARVRQGQARDEGERP